jgi:hypothetical protein
MLSSILGTPGVPSSGGTPTRPRSRLRARSSASTISLSSASRSTVNLVKTSDEEDAELKHLNICLEMLAEVFPDVQIEVFREMLATYSTESRLHVVLEALLKNPTRWVRGRKRLLEGEENLVLSASGDAVLVDPVERFRSPAYKKAVKAELSKEFKGLSLGTINAVLAENNYSYTAARPTLFNIASKSWRYSITTLFRRKTTRSLAVENHPLVYFPSKQADDTLPIVPRIRPTDCHELNQELHDNIVIPAEKDREKLQLVRDAELADILNQAEAEENEELYDCECCFVGNSVDKLTACSSGEHMICHRCCQFAMNEALFGQNWARSILPERATMKCIAPLSDGECQGCIPEDQLNRAIVSQDGGDLVWIKFQSRISSDAIAKVDSVKLVRCPFCHYAEVDDRPLLSPKSESFSHVFVTALLRVMFGPLLIIILTLLFFFSLINSSSSNGSNTDPFTSFNNSLADSRQRISTSRRKPSRFTCQSPQCGRASCTACLKPWRDPHECHDSLLTSYRTTVDQALSNALKRTCPDCNTSFIKSSGCNKLVCPCGYIMCYLCRSAIKTEGYSHFCSHFRPLGGNCTECDKCDLYKGEDEEMVLRKAREKAEKQWKVAKKEELDGVDISEVQRQTEGKGASGRRRGKDSSDVPMELWLQHWLDWILDTTE